MSNISTKKKEALLAILDARTAALVEGNKIIMSDMFMDNFVYTNAHGRVFDKTTYLDSFVGSVDMVWQSQEASEIKLWVYHDMAIISCLVHDIATYHGRAFDAHFRTTHTLVKDAGRWKFAASHTSPVVSS